MKMILGAYPFEWFEVFKTFAIGAAIGLAVGIPLGIWIANI